MSLTADPFKLWVIDCGARYWPRGGDLIAALSVSSASEAAKSPESMSFVMLPEWAADIGVEGQLLVPTERIASQPANLPVWQRCDWLAAAGDFLTGAAERQHEARHGPILSYSFRLSPALAPLHSHAWVNRMFLFLRRWISHEKGVAEHALFGPRPQARIVLTHDVDAVHLTPEIRAKQTAFQLMNCARAFRRSRFSIAAVRLRDARRFAFSIRSLQTLELVRRMECEAGLRSVLHFYAGAPGLKRGSLKTILLDPSYDIASAYLVKELRAFVEGGWTVGLHPSYNAWNLGAPISRQRERLEAVVGIPVQHCRQHWLHFAWTDTWRVQCEAGLCHDSTLGFNDRPGFRTGHALALQPFDPARGTAIPIETLPMVLMDSHFYDYDDESVAAEPLANRLRPWIEELHAVGGEASVNWHTHTINEIYGWREGYEALLSALS